MAPTSTRTPGLFAAIIACPANLHPNLAGASGCAAPPRRCVDEDRNEEEMIRIPSRIPPARRRGQPALFSQRLGVLFHGLHQLLCVPPGRVTGNFVWADRAEWLSRSSKAPQQR
jgi:hypothetical protein